jgi:Domain of unknown function (DUF4263)
MKQLATIPFSASKCAGELEELKKLLSNHNELEENRHILPFFKARSSLSAFIGSLFPEMNTFEKTGHEFDLFGDYKADLVVADNSNEKYCFIEFEDAKKSSLFKSTTKFSDSFSQRYECGFSQLIDWFYILEDQKNTELFRKKLGNNVTGYFGALIIGRDHFLTDANRKRLEWRSNNVIVNSRHIYCYTYDTLYKKLKEKLDYFNELKSLR